ncbi:MAG TPA: hypothetical protein VKC56_00690 [Gallionellaceae bacterium]|nr:hypothetical protein [Gallionellaceae bacterium]
MNELTNDDVSIPAFLRKTGPARQAEELEAFKCAIRSGGVEWIVADYAVDKACSPGKCLGVLAARLFRACRAP